MDEMSISGSPPVLTPTPTLESLEIFTESDDSNPLHVHYDFDKKEPFSIVPDEDIIEEKVRKKVKRHYKVKNKKNGDT